MQQTYRRARNLERHAQNTTPYKAPWEYSVVVIDASPEAVFAASEIQQLPPGQLRTPAE